MDDISTSLDDWMMETKLCRYCDQVKPLDDFYKRPERNGRPSSRCKACVASYVPPEQRIRPDTTPDSRTHTRVPSSLLLRDATDVERDTVEQCASAMIAYEVFLARTTDPNAHFHGTKPIAVLEALDVSERRSVQLMSASIQRGPAQSWAVRRDHRATREAA